MFINDVGQNTWEEINDGVAGANYGWPDAEGPTLRDPELHARRSTPTTTAPARPRAARSPAARSTTRPRCSSRPTTPATTSSPTTAADWIYRLDLAGRRHWSRRPSRPASARRSTCRWPTTAASTTSRAAAARHGPPGSDLRTAAASPPITTQPASQTVSVGQSATFSVSASGSAPLSYQWQRNRSTSPARRPSYTLSNAQLADNGALFRCVVTNAFGSVTSTSAC